MRTLHAAAVAIALLAGAPATAQMQPDLGTEAQRASGKVLYQKYCSQCHGDAGDGKGPAWEFLKPWPRDLTSGKFKFRTTPSGSMPTTADIERVIVRGIPYTSMPAFDKLKSSEVRDIAFYVKTFSPRFSDPEYLQSPISVGEPPSLTQESIARGRELYENNGCIRCHGELGYSDGKSAPTLKDDWGQHIRSADLSQPWTFRSGPRREDIYRAFSTGLNGTPMPSYYDTLSEEDRWDLTNYIYSIGEGEDPGYDSLVVVAPIDGEIDLSRGAELFEGTEPARFPLVGQIMEPGRSMYTATSSVVVNAVASSREIAIMVRWHDMLADTAGTNDPTLQVPRWREELKAAEAASAEGEDEDDFWGAEEEDEGDDFWREEEDDDATSISVSEFSDAVAIQLPASVPEGNRKPYFLLGDPQNPVDLWFVDLGTGRVSQWAGRGSASVVPNDVDDIEMVNSYADGEWTVVVKRSLKSGAGVTFREEMFLPVAFSVWDGLQRERGNKRALSQWVYLYVQPREVPSVVGPMVKAGLVALIVELIVLALLRRHFRGPGASLRESGAVRSARPAGAAS